MTASCKILGISYYLPAGVESSSDLAQQYPDWSVAKISEKTGVVTRHVASDDETASDLAYEAARKLLARKLADCSDVDYLLFCTQSPDHYIPPASCRLQQRLNLRKHTGALDFNLGCSGFIYGLQLAQSLILTKQARNVLLVLADTYTKYIHPKDRTVRALFGDGAAAALIGPSNGEDGTVGPFVMGTDGTGSDAVVVPSGGLRLPRSPATGEEYKDESGCVRSQDNLFMDGRAVFGFALSTVPPLVSQVVKTSGLRIDQIDWFIYHQANKFMLENLARLSAIPEEKMAYALEEVGNTVSASIPITIQKYVEKGKILPGHRLLLVGFGVGYSWGACVATWPH